MKLIWSGFAILRYWGEIPMMERLSKSVEKALEMGAHFADARLENRKLSTIFVVNDELRSYQNMSVRGVGIRALVGGSWGLSSTTQLDADSLLEAAEMAVRIAKHNAQKVEKEVSLDSARSLKKSLGARVKKNPLDVDSESKLSFVMDLTKAQKVDDRVVNTNSRYGERIYNFLLVNSLGSELEWEEIRTFAFAHSVAAEGDKREFSYDIKDGTKGFELIDEIDPNAMGEKVGNESIELLGAKRPPNGMMTVVADPDISGLLAHEVMGHASEADEVVKERSFLTPMVGKRVGSDLISMVDDGTYPGANGMIPFDSEGTPSAHTSIIEKGVYRGYMHNLETAAEMGVEPTGNGRAEDFSRRVWVRMTNTYFEKGPDSLDEMIAETKEGILTSKAMRGMEDPVGGGFEAVALKGYIIKNGEVTDPIPSFTLAGSALDILNTVDMASKEFELSGGTCGKGDEDWVNVSSGGPYIRAKIVVGGA
ncbi:MAG: TldD/PmbA family protein [Methanobacteriota archaeon]|nr:MAG: TldD/PmbA family protein [Euryarchaeota archaeon]